MSVNLGNINNYQVQRNMLFAQWLTELEMEMRKLDSAVTVETFQFSNMSYVGPLQALIGSSAGENKFYITLLHFDQWGAVMTAVQIAKQIIKTLKEYNA